MYLAGISTVRLLTSRQSVISLMLLAFAMLVAIAWSLRGERDVLEFTEELLLPVYITFLLPIFCLCYGVGGISSDREERTLVYLLVTPVPRPLVHLAKFVASMVLALAWSLGGMALLCIAAGAPGWGSFQLFWPATLWATIAYVALFHLLSVLFQRATIIAIAYALFLEAVVGNMPGIVKRVAITYYTRCMIFDAGAPLGMGPAGRHNPDLYLPISGQAAWIVLFVLAGAFFLIGTWAFSRREYL
jgi:ABC-type transport system involved in multi-copper enzyme maturation permease subunit